MKRILHFKNPMLSESEYDFILKNFVELSSEDFDEVSWAEENVFNFLTDGLEVRLSLGLLEELSKEFLAISLTERYIYIKNEGLE